MKRKTYLKKLAIIILATSFYGGICQANPITDENTYQKTVGRIVSGQVVDESGSPIINAIVSVPGASSNVLTDMDGKFIISVPTGSHQLSVSFIGYRTAQMKLKNTVDNLIITLAEDAHEQDAMISVAQMRKEKRNSLTSAISTISGDELKKYPSGSLSEALAGRLAGLSVQLNSSEPTNDRAYTLIRGYNSSNGNQPLIVLDGVPSPTLDFNVLDPNTIESFSILKDAAACAAYGFQGSGGVILITTQRGHNGKPRVSVSADFSLQEATKKPDMIHSWEYAELRNQALRNDGLKETFSNEDIETYRNGGNRDLFPDNNWYKIFMKDMTTMQRYNVNITGGGNRIKYFVSAGFTDQGNLIKVQEKEKFNPSRYMQRFNERTNVDVQVLPNLSAFINQMVIIEKSNTSRVGTGSIIEGIFKTPAIQHGPLTPEGGVVCTPWQPQSVYEMINRTGYNRYVNTTTNLSFGMNWGLDFITKGLALKGTIGYETRTQSGIFGDVDCARFIRDEDVKDELTFIPYGSTIDKALSLSKGSNYRYYLNFNGTLQYDRMFNEVHEVSSHVNYFVQNTIREGGGVQILPYDQIGFNIHAKYGYKSKYYVQADASWMTSDQFKRHHRYGFFPTISGSWIISEENFIKEKVGSWLTLLKIRASYGKIGNNQLPGSRYMYLDDIRLGGGGFINSLYGGAKINEVLLGNPHLKWEDSYQQNYGINIGLFNAFTINFDYFKYNTKDIVLKDNSIPALQGMPSGKRAYMNAGKTQTQGVEVEIGYTKQLNKDWHININGNLAYSKNKVIEANEINRSSSNFAYPYRQIGYAINQHFGYLIDYSNGNGLYNSEQEIKDSKLIYEGITPRPGDFRYQDLNNDGTINEQDKAPIGFDNLPRISYGADVQLNYKNFDMYVQIQGIGQISGYFSGIGVTEQYGQGVYTQLHKEAWTPERYAAGEKISYPALSTRQSSSLQPNDFFICNRSFMRLKNVEFGYSLPKELCRKIHTEKIRFYLNGSNLLTWNNLKFKDFDPESGNLGSYPIYRTYNVGLNITF